MKVFDVSAANMKELEEKGAKVASGIADIAKSCDTIITMLPATQHVSSVLREVDGIFANAKRGTLIIDCSTIDPVESRKLNNEATALGLHMIDAPVLRKLYLNKSIIVIGVGWCDWCCCRNIDLHGRRFPR